VLPKPQLSDWESYQELFVPINPILNRGPWII